MYAQVALWQTIGILATPVVGLAVGVLAWRIGRKQTEINQRLLDIQDYTSVIVVPRFVGPQLLPFPQSLQVINQGSHPVHLETLT